MDTLHDKFIITNNKLNNDISSIKQAFINFYGEKHNDYIISVLDGLNVIWYDDIQQKEDKDIKDIIISSVPEDKLDQYLSKYARKFFYKVGI